MMNSIRQGGNKQKKSNSKHSISHSKQKASVEKWVDSEKLKENVTVTVRFRPLSVREIRQGEEIAWYADGETIVRNEHNSSIAYAYDQVFGPTTTTCQVYDIAARHVVSGAMEGINGTIFAYGVTSSGKTHTMHGDQRSPGIIPLAVKDAFSIIQETPRREFLIRLSYMEIYNEVVNDLLNPAGQNLKIREDGQGTFVEGIKEEVVLSPGHALSVIAAGEEQRHVGSTTFNIHSSRSHTIFSLTIESSPCGEDNKDEAVNLSQLNLIDLAGSESSKAETVGIRRKEGSYINKSLLTLGTVISKLTDGKASHIPYRDSKLTRLLQSSLSGHGRVSLIFTVTPSSSNSEETHNTLKFAHRAKHIEVKASQNKIVDEKSLIKTYQNEIRSLKEELEQLSDTVTVSELKHTEGNDVLLKKELEDDQVTRQSISEQEEAKAALLSQIQNLSKLILVSTKSSNLSTLPHHPAPGSRYSFGEEELAYLPHRRRDLSLDDEDNQLHITLDGGPDTKDALKEDKKIKKTGLLNWLKPRKRDSTSKGLTSASEKSRAKSASTPSSPGGYRILPTESRHSYSAPSTESTSVTFLSEARKGRETNKDAILQQEAPPASIKTSNQIDLLREQQRILSVEVANHFTALKRLSEEATRDGNEESIKRVQVEMTKLNDEIKRTNKQISLLEDQATHSVIPSLHKMDDVEKARSVSMLETQFKEASIELEAQAMKNQVIQELLNQKNNESTELKDTITELKQQLSSAHDLRNPDELNIQTENTTINDSGELLLQQTLVRMETENTTENDSRDVLFQQAEALELEQMKQKVATLTESKEQLEAENRSLAEECSYAKELAAAAATELNALSEEVMKLLSHNEILSAELLAVQKNSPNRQKNSSPTKKKKEQGPTHFELKRELALSKERELAYEAILAEKYKKESELQQTVKELKQREAYLETEVANMWLLVERLKKVQGPEITIMESE